MPAQSQTFAPRIGLHTQSKQVGVDDAYSDARLFLPLGDTSFMQYLDARLLVDSSGSSRGSNIGGGIRGYIEGLDAVWGSNVFADHRQTETSSFHQLGLGFELLFQDVELRVNFYNPVGNQRTTFGPNPASSGENLFVFNNNYLLYGSIVNQQARVEQSLQGFDAEIGANLGSDLFAGVASKSYLGIYQFKNPGLEDVHGVSARFNINAMDRFDFNTGVQHDNFFGTQYTAGLTVYTSLRRKEPSPLRYLLADRMNDPAVRRSAITVASGIIRDAPTFIAERLRYDSDGSDVRVVHVDSNAKPGGDGTFENPLNDVGQVQSNSQNRDIVYLYSGSVFDGQNSLLLQENQRLLGEGGNYTHWIDSRQAGTVALPNVNGISGDIPIIQNSISSGVRLANRTTVANVSVIDPIAGAGIHAIDAVDALVLDSFIATTANDIYGIFTEGASLVTVQDSSITTGGRFGFGLYSRGTSNLTANRIQLSTSGIYGAAVSVNDTATATVSDQSMITTTGPGGFGVFGQDHGSATLTRGTTVQTSGQLGHGLLAHGSSNLAIDDVDVSVSGPSASGAESRFDGTVTVQNGSSVRTHGTAGYGIYTTNNGTTVVKGSSIETSGPGSEGFKVQRSGRVTVEGSSVKTSGVVSPGFRIEMNSTVAIMSTMIESDQNEEIHVTATDSNQHINLTINNNNLADGDGQILLNNAQQINGSTVTVHGTAGTASLATDNGISVGNITEQRQIDYSP
ncbi:inverse autotransporter beta domain-containing protein [Rubripirellula reticaptiva]|uniref:Inverse autotransporter beta-domain domain-containing protein n=1 Tax=Rubripirellula reticaptiva TaxID=2528013 RepID=A0A5C6F9Q2_9BACT|nr:inverse autotransporter beta domain-containing protein [Rubripirellula reticaptiva]TWU58118.1 hypothetical protein Poly59_10270 [Rubripirellula reticaptiva]